MSSETSHAKIRILLVGTQRLVYDSLHLLLERRHDCLVVGKTACADEVASLLQALHPDLLLADLDFPDGVNFQFATQLCDYAAVSAVPLAVLTMWVKQPIICELLQLPIHACLSKDMDGDELIETLKLLKNRGGAKDFVIFDYQQFTAKS